MKKTFKDLWLVVTNALAGAFVLIMILWAAGCFTTTAEAATEPEPVSHFNTQVLETWCGEPTGTIRMVGGWAYCEDVLEDETGNLWGYDGLDEEAFYLVWIDDMGTPDYVQDDEIVKVWREI